MEPSRLCHLNILELDKLMTRQPLIFLSKCKKTFNVFWVFKDILDQRQNFVDVNTKFVYIFFSVQTKPKQTRLVAVII
jgi:hypothetical protein